MPASVTVIRPHGDINAGPSGLIFFSDQSGAVPVTIIWTQDDGNGGTCAGNASSILQLQPATRIGRMKNIRPAEHQHPNLKFTSAALSGMPGTGEQEVRAACRCRACFVALARLPGSTSR